MQRLKAEYDKSYPTCVSIYNNKTGDTALIGADVARKLVGELKLAIAECEKHEHEKR